MSFRSASGTEVIQHPLRALARLLCAA
jgi:hypothetical protein